MIYVIKLSLLYNDINASEYHYIYIYIYTQIMMIPRYYSQTS